MKQGLPLSLVLFLFIFAAIPTLVASKIMGYFYKPEMVASRGVLAKATLSNGKVIVAEADNTALIRKNEDGSKDFDFMSRCTAPEFNGRVLAVAIQDSATRSNPVAGNQEKILVGGQFTRFDLSLAGHIVRLNADGTVDPSFSLSNGVGFDDEVTSIQIESTGKIRVAGKFEKFNGVYVGPQVLLNPDGSLDQSENQQTAQGPSDLRLRNRQTN